MKKFFAMILCFLSLTAAAGPLTVVVEGESRGTHDVVIVASIKADGSVDVTVDKSIGDMEADKRLASVIRHAIDTSKVLAWYPEGKTFKSNAKVLTVVSGTCMAYVSSNYLVDPTLMCPDMILQ